MPKHIDSLMHGLVLLGHQEGWLEQVEIPHDVEDLQPETIVVRMSGQRVRLSWEVLGPVGFTCPRCGKTSHNPNDVRAGYCGQCHDWTGTPVV